MSAALTPFLSGLALGLALIAAIGAQNAFVLRQGLRRQHVGAVVAFCATMDAVLIGLGVFGASWTARHVPGLEGALRLGGALFLLGYALLAFRRALQSGGRLQAASRGNAPLPSVLAQAAAFTLLNPHVYLDTVLLVGSVGAQQPAGTPRLAFAAGAALASVLWFSLLGTLAQCLAPWLEKPAVWRALDGVMAVLLAILGIQLLR